MAGKNKTKRQAVKKPKPELQPWENSNNEKVDLYLPAHFRMLCSLMGVPAEKILEDFITTLSGAYHSLGEEPRAKLEEYFNLCGYGRKRYTEEELRRMLYELNAIYRLWPDQADGKLIDLHAEWRRAYDQYWYEKWKRLREIEPGP